MDENWSFHGRVAVPLEHMGKNEIEDWNYSADEITNGKFADAVVEFANLFFNDNFTTEEFKVKCEPFRGLSYNHIPKEAAKEIFDELQNMYNAQRLM